MSNLIVFKFRLSLLFIGFRNVFVIDREVYLKVSQTELEFKSNQRTSKNYEHVFPGSVSLLASTFCSKRVSK